MSPVREKFVKIIESLPYNLQEEIYKRETFEILKDITQRYFDTYGIDDLSDEDKEVIHNILCDNFKIFEKNKTDIEKGS